MMIIGFYPDQLYDNYEHTLEQIYNTMLETIPTNNSVALHILPFQISCGDGGFAIDDWYQVDSAFGSWNDIERFSKKWKVIVDGVFNHVGINHKLVKDFLCNPIKYKDYFFTNQQTNLHSPRGQTADGIIKTSNGNVLVRQTHTPKAIDINLENTGVILEITNYIDFLKEKNIWGIRLDAVAYYKKGEHISHNQGSENLAKSIVDLVKEKELQVFAQLDCDFNGLRYFDEAKYHDVSIYDFSYSAYLCSSLITKNTVELCEYLNKKSLDHRILIRAPRTHDGILLRSGNLSINCKNRIIEFANRNGLKIRKAQNNIYEINCSLPYILKLISPKLSNNIIKMIIVFTGLLNSIPYFYYPFIQGYIPEQEYKALHIPQRFENNDPRTINRIPISLNYSNSNQFHKVEIKRILSSLAGLYDTYEEELLMGDSQYMSLGSCVKVSTANHKIQGIFNFSDKQQSLIINKKEVGQVLFDSRVNQSDTLNAYEFFVYLKN